MKYIILFISVVFIALFGWYILTFESSKMPNRLTNIKYQVTSLASGSNLLDQNRLTNIKDQVASLTSGSNLLGQTSITGGQYSISDLIVVSGGKDTTIAVSSGALLPKDQPTNIVQDQTAKNPSGIGIIDQQIPVEPDPEFENIRGLVNDLLE